MQRSDEILAQLKAQAALAARNSYSPYSQFPVGAAVSDATGRIHVGCNVENASLGLTQCAERAALAAAIANGAGPGSLRYLVIYTPGADAHPPCGACRQVMHELMPPDGLVMSCCDSGQVRTWSLSECLPDAFSDEGLRKPAG